VWNFHGAQFGLEFYAGWLTEYSLSVDNLFIFVVIMAGFNALGAVAIQQFSSIFHIFGAFLLYTAVRLVRDTDHGDDAENTVVRLARQYFPTTDTWDGLKLYVKEGGRRLMTPMYLFFTANLFALNAAEFGRHRVDAVSDDGGQPDQDPAGPINADEGGHHLVRVRLSGIIAGGSGVSLAWPTCRNCGCSSPRPMVHGRS
jgi:hypothetical protein